MARPEDRPATNKLGKWVASQRAQNDTITTLRVEVEALRTLQAMLVDDPEDVSAGVPEHLIEAGTLVLERADNDLANHISGETIDWDYGMEAAAVFKAMLRAALKGGDQPQLCAA